MTAAKHINAMFIVYFVALASAISAVDLGRGLTHPNLCFSRVVL
jgi:hypothetical protein